MEDLLEIKSLTVDYASVDGRVRPLESVSLRTQKGEIVGIVGESGSGKTTLGLAIIGLLDTPPAEIVSGSIIFEGRDLLKLNQSELTGIRGTGIGMVFQESLVSLNPVYKTEAQLKESLKVLGRARKLKLTSVKEHDMMIDVLRSLYLDKPEAVVKKYPHELSGGMRQRISIAMAMVEEPTLLILDEVTTGLDVYVQNRMLALLRGLNRKLGVTMILITHDLTVASQICDRLYVMYAGRLMEVGEAEDVLSAPLHPYTQGLTAAVPQGFADSPPLPVTAGEPPDLRNLPKGCKFYPRCPYAMEICEEKEPPLLEAGNERYVSCWLRGKI
jgi:oligopeptide/dipeptide ABC transporter ATP-binding protein